MNILFWADGFWPRIGGTETQGFQFIQEMQKRGHLCIVLAQKDHSNMKDEEVHQGIVIKRFDFNGVIKKGELKTMHFLKRCLEQILAAFRPDLVYLNTLGNGSAFAFLFFRSLFSMPTFLTVHAPYYENSLPPLALQICSTIDVICTASKWGHAQMQRLLPNMLHKIKWIPYGLSLPDLIPTSLCFSPPTILALGRLSSEKGFEVAIEAFSLLKPFGIGARLLIAGEGEERPFLEKEVKRLGLQNCVDFTGGLTRDGDAVFQVLNLATCVVMPSHFEAFGLVALESMRMGRPVIASDVGGLPEIISHLETGLLVPPKNPSALCKAMNTLLSQPKKTVEMGEKARKWAIRTYLLTDHVDLYEDLFAQTIGNPR